ncbi:hypothetical protein [Nostoc sp. ChiQUE01b]|nr:hypothetical protein [Nostoc sp. ChiQUE01b]
MSNNRIFHRFGLQESLESRRARTQKRYTYHARSAAGSTLNHFS